MSELMESLKARIQLIEKTIQESVVNHNGLLARLEEAKHFLDMATKIAGELAPHNPVVEDMQAVDKVADEVGDAVAHIEDAVSPQA
jgi:hypothetical protein